MKKTQLQIVSIVKQVDNSLQKILGEDIPKLKQIKDFTVKGGGKRIRPILSYLLYQLWAKDHPLKSDFKNKDAYDLCAIPEIIHAASLLHDDVLDEAEERRGKPSGRKLFGNKDVILAGDYLLACGISRLNKFRNPDLMDVFTSVIKDLSVSELLQMEYRSNPKINYEIYHKIIYGKTASLFRACCEAPAVWLQQSRTVIDKAGKAGEGLGLVFQLRDDWLDYFKPEELKKEPWQDYINGVITYPVLCLKGQIPEKEYNLLVKDICSQNIEAKKENAEIFVKKLRNFGAEEFTLKKLQTEYHKVQHFFASYPDSPECKLILAQFDKLTLNNPEKKQ